ncbi:hypothetical protein AAF143_06300 [Cyanobium sp. ATX-6F1]
MADVYRRRSGRGWRLRQHSLALLEQWQGLLAAAGQPVELRRGLLLLAHDGDDWQRQQALVCRSGASGPPLELRTASALEGLEPALPRGALGGSGPPVTASSIPAAGVKRWSAMAAPMA